MLDPHKALDYQQSLATFTRILCEATNPPRVLQNSVAQIARITNIKHVKALRYRPDRGDLLIEAGVGWRPGVVGHVSFGADRHSAPGRSLQTGQPVVESKYWRYLHGTGNWCVCAATDLHGVHHCQ